MFELPTVDYPTDDSPDDLAGLELRPYAGEDDLPELIRVHNAEAEADGDSERHSLESMRAHFAHPSDTFDAARDVTVAELEGRVVGWAERRWVDVWDSEVREYRIDGYVDPPFRRRGFGRALLHENQRLQRALAATHDTSRVKMFGSWSADSQAGDNALLESEGFQRVRWFFDMIRRSMDSIPDVPLPDGLEIRPITSDLVRRVWDADLEAFSGDHWGGFDASEANFRRWTADPTFDPTLWVVAFDGEEPAGGVINSINQEENEILGTKRGWLNSVWTRRPWRRRGIARATIARSLALLRDRGMTTAGLGVDADNPSGALGLYKDLGFEVNFRSAAWRRPLESR